MVQQYFMEHQTLFKDEDVFESEFTPDIIQSRDTQLRQLAETLRPALHGARPINTIIRGPPGTGKTTCVRRIFSELETTGTRHVLPVMVSCQQIHSVTGVFNAIFRKLFRQKGLVAGIPLERITDPVCAALIKKKTVLVVCLDDADVIARTHQLNDILRSLLRLHESYPGVRTGVVATMNTPSIRLPDILEPAVLSVYQPEEIRFPPYDEDDIHRILHDRVHCGIYPGVISSTVLDRITDITVTEGDIRTGIGLLKQAVTHAEGRGHSTVQDHDLQPGLREARRVRIAEVIRDLSPEERRLLTHIATFQRADPSAECTSRVLYDSFRENGFLSYSTFTRRLNRLADLRTIDLVRRQAPGNTRNVRLRLNATMICELCR